jgi:transcription elongation factor GreA
MSTTEMTAKHEVHVGCTVSFTDQRAERDQTFTIVASHDVSAMGGRLSAASPVAKALLGHRVGDRVEVRTPKGIRPLLVAAIA